MHNMRRAQGLTVPRGCVWGLRVVQVTPKARVQIPGGSARLDIAWLKGLTGGVSIFDPPTLKCKFAEAKGLDSRAAQRLVGSDSVTVAGGFGELGVQGTGELGPWRTSSMRWRHSRTRAGQSARRGERSYVGCPCMYRGVRGSRPTAVRRRQAHGGWPQVIEKPPKLPWRRGCRGVLRSWTDAGSAGV
jgi:hypothetical protein